MAEPLYLAANPLDAQIVRDWLLLHRIPVRIEGAVLWGGVGDLPANQWPRLYCEDERDVERARALIAQRERDGRQAEQLWACGCGERSPGTFELCWSCGRERPA